MSSGLSRSRRKIRKPYIKMPVMILMGVLALWMLSVIISRQEVNDDTEHAGFSENYVKASEIPGFFSYTYYTKEEWETKLSGKISDKITWGDLEYLSEILGVSEYVTIDGKKNEVVTRSRFMEVYRQILDLLDLDGSVTRKIITVNKKSVSKKGNIVVLSKRQFFGWEAPEEYLVENACYTVFVQGETILGVEAGMPGTVLLSEQEEEKKTNDDVRVIIKNGESLYYDNIYITCADDMLVTQGDEEKRTEANKRLTVNAADFEKSEKPIRISVDGTKKLYLCSKEGEKISLGYGGIFYIYCYDEGLLLINEIDMEEYLCAVVPSEMPAGFEIEALKAQAVCARSYLVSQMDGGEYVSLRAHVDDSTRFQVYNKQSRDEKTTKAVYDTKGEILTYQGNVVTAYYFSTSCGTTSGYSLWELDKECFGYLANTGREKYGKLKDEQDFREFIRDTSLESYDSGSPYFRWNAEWKPAKYEMSIKTAVSERKKQAPDTVELKWDSGVERSYEALGKLVKIKDIDRENSGCISSLTLVYEHGFITLKSEYTIRYCLGRGVEEVALQDGSTRSMAMLPSAYCALIPLESGDYKIYGGGYGHGVGMSQYGANGMAESGYSYWEILKYYYHNVERTKYGEE